MIYMEESADLWIQDGIPPDEIDVFLQTEITGAHTLTSGYIPNHPPQWVRQNIKTISVMPGKYTGKYFHLGEYHALQRLRFEYGYNNATDFAQIGGSRVVSLDVGPTFTRPLTNIHVLQDLQELYLGDQFNETVDALSSCWKLKILHFGNSFCQPLQDSVKQLLFITELQVGQQFSRCFNNAPLKDYLHPKSNLTVLRIMSQYPVNQMLVGLEHHLEELYLSGGFNHPLSFKGYHMKNLDMGRDCHHSPTLSISSNHNNSSSPLLDTLWCPQDALHKDLRYKRLYISPSTSETTMFLFVRVLHLHFRIDMTKMALTCNTFKSLPCLETVDFGYHFNQSLNDSLWTVKHLKDLYIDGLFRQPGLSLALPEGHHPSLQNVYLSNYYNHEVPAYLQEKVHYGSYWDLLTVLEDSEEEMVVEGN